MPQKIKYLKRYTETGRQLCIGNDNTCPNLAGYKETRGSVKKYHNECDKHRRHNHAAIRLKFKHRASYIHIKKCEHCNKKAVHRHRIDRSAGYKLGNIIGLCLPCHQKIHSI